MVSSCLSLFWTMLSKVMTRCDGWWALLGLVVVFGQEGAELVLLDAAWPYDRVSDELGLWMLVSRPAKVLEGWKTLAAIHLTSTASVWTAFKIWLFWGP